MPAAEVNRSGRCLKLIPEVILVNGNDSSSNPEAVRRAEHLCDPGRRGQHLIFGFILVESEFKLGLNAVLNDADLEHRQPSAR
ncbi:hypothetical protein EYF80_039792 [Liparis tanakae]|uniref:Uncharacterized protein n=1 Tax=Liparis tanakae TaxID=230148 RepID=A0A4Z2GB83_9TELE|nr:hypothetical protein EYF80_039792 [Liparis tanakae]